MSKPVNEDAIVTLLKGLYKLKERYDFRCIINSTLLEYNIAIFRNEKHLIDILNEYHIDTIEITTHPTEFRLETHKIKNVTFEDNLILLEMIDDKIIRIKIQNKK